MKLSRGEAAVLLITVVLLALMAGYSLGASRTQTLEPNEALSQTDLAEVPEPSEGWEPVDINTAGLEELMTLPGIGETRARAILEYRDEHGAFSHVEDLIQVTGIGESIVARLLEYATAGGTEYAENTGS